MGKFDKVIWQKLCNLEVPTGSVDNSDIVDAINNLALIITNKPEIEGLDLIRLCDATGITGYISYILDEETNVVTELYWDSTGVSTTVKPLGEACISPDYEYKIRGTFCREVNGVQYELDYCDIFIDDQLESTVEYWYAPDGSVSNITPSGTITMCTEDCSPAVESFTGDNATLAEYNELEIFIPKCCEVTLTTSAGIITLPSQPAKSYYTKKFDCFLTSYSISSSCDINTITTVLTKTK